MIVVICPGCQTKLTAKDELVGKVGKCPKCGKAVRIVKPAGGQETVALAEEVAPDQHVHGFLEEKLPPIQAPERLVRQNRYLICDKTKVFAAWENNGQGWMLKTSAGVINASRNSEKLPAQGEFTLVELKMQLTDEGLRLAGVMTFELAKRWAVTKLEHGDDRILTSLVGPGRLNKEQKSAVVKHLHEQFMRAVYSESHQVLDYLSNNDFHSPGVG
jgi:hypothetical protein